jgi:hypothetical protein
VSVATPAASAELPRGERDVIVLQLSGEVRWSVYGSGKEAAPEKTFTALATSGSAVYMPRGFWRACEPQSAEARRLEPGRPQELYGWTDAPRPFAEMPDEEYCARLLGRHLAAALDGVDPGCKVIDYEDLIRGQISEIARFFGLELPEDEQLDRVFTVYSMDPRRAMRFQDDRHRKRRQASAALRSAAQEHAMANYIELRSRGAW